MFSFESIVSEVPVLNQGKPAVISTSGSDLEVWCIRSLPLVEMTILFFEMTDCLGVLCSGPADGDRNTVSPECAGCLVKLSGDSAAAVGTESIAGESIIIDLIPVAYDQWRLAVGAEGGIALDVMYITCVDIM